MSPMANTDITYKVTALYLLYISKVPLSLALICEFFVKRNYRDYFNTVSIIGELSSSKLIDAEITNNITLYSINEAGISTLMPMTDHISNKIKADITEFLKANDISIKETKSLYADYDNSPTGGYILHLMATEENLTIIDLKLNIGNENIAKSICTNWKLNYRKIYDILMDNLI